jgi:uncharacterized protein (DUF433 family)
MVRGGNMETPTNKLNGWRTRPEYTITQAAKLAGTSSATVRRWLRGYYEGENLRMRPVFGDKQTKQEASVEISFLQLAEIVVVSRFRHRYVKLERLRRAHRYARDALHIDYPFAWLRLKTDGAHVLSEFQEQEPGEKLVSLDLFGQLTLPGDVLRTLELFDYEEEFAARWFPIGRNVPIVIDPRYGAGKPTIPERRLTVETIYKRWKAGQTIKFIASDFKLLPSLVETTLQYAENYTT